MSRRLERLRAILTGEGDGLDAAEDGMISMIAMLTVLMFLALAIVLGNAARIVNEKIEAQSAADAVAASAATQKARGLNAVTGINHLLGELLGLIVAHNAIAGDDLPNIKHKDDLTAANTFLQAAFETARVLAQPQPTQSIYDKVHDDLKCEAAVRDAHKQLKFALGGIYTTMAVGGALQQLKAVPFVGPALYAAGTAIVLIAKALEIYAFAEWGALKVMREAASATTKPVKLLFEQSPKAASRIVKLMETQMPLLMKGTAEKIGRLNGGEGAMHLLDGKLPLVDDPKSNASRKEDMPKSQLVRASWPFVVYHRHQLFQLTSWMVLSGFRGHYKTQTEKYMLEKSYAVYREQRVYPRVLVGMTDPDRKGSEPWVNNPVEAERRFAVLGFALRKAPTPWGGSLFAGEKPRDLVTFAQALVYNANDQKPGLRGQTQQVIGWDTLNWEPGSTAYEYPFPNSYGKADPKVKLNWQVKLIPVTRLRVARQLLPTAFRQGLKDIDPSSVRAKLH